jgi:hypothetical protein
MGSNAGGVLVQKEVTPSDFELAYRLHKLENNIISIEKLMPFRFTDISVSKAKSKEIEIRREIDEQLEYIIKNNRRNAALDYLNFSIGVYEAEERILKLYKTDLKSYIEGMETDIKIMQASPNDFVPLAPAYTTITYITIVKSSEKNLDSAFSIIKEVKKANEEIIRMADFGHGRDMEKDLGIGAPI